MSERDDVNSELSEPEISDRDAASDADILKVRVPMEKLASRFMEELRSGRKPSVQSYAAAHPRFADEIRRTFPVLAALEGLKLNEESTWLKRGFADLEVDRLGGCDIIGEVARGGMGIVFEGLEKSSGRRVAVKLLPWRVDSVPQVREAFEREARLASQLRHSNIVPIYGFGEHEGYCYYTMRYVDGVSLDRLIERLKEREGVVYAEEISRARDDRSEGAASPAKSSPASNIINGETKSDPVTSYRHLKRKSYRKFARIGIQVARALHAAHERGVLHNDVKPGNVLIGADGKVWVTDFGVATAARTGSEGVDEEHESYAGTLRYMAPERFRGKSDRRGDIYALGATLYELVTRRPIFDAKSRSAMVDRIANVIPVQPSVIDPEFPIDFESIIAKAIAKRPEDRYATAGEMGADLLAFSGGHRPHAAKRRFVRRVVNRLRHWLGIEQR
ncbi:serine/threonine-protein kinase [Stratiformator vulcanicus]|uniref:Serine/threonine-protein kinase PknH n=1 Tax=Stratiformator vulcanicus TaxID=2527980 RepID=A0A517R5T9_9PLAN|nr:serine/threonine-protein kinase [Stratiformator vulcanicus]QDT39264.1 Serine/threonine-protein kinase PknH [Stratiformator vulcanicus]